MDKHKSIEEEFFVYFKRPSRMLGIDLSYSVWKDDTPFLMYSAKKGTKLLIDKIKLRKPTTKK